MITMTTIEIPKQKSQLKKRKEIMNVGGDGSNELKNGIRAMCVHRF